MSILLDYEAALRDLLHFYDRARGAVGHGEGWTAADVLRLEEIRSLVPVRDLRISPDGHSRALEARREPNAPGMPPKPRKTRKTRENGS